MTDNGKNIPPVYPFIILNFNTKVNHSRLNSRYTLKKRPVESPKKHSTRGRDGQTGLKCGFPPCKNRIFVI